MASATQERIKPGISGVTETMLVTLAARAADAASPSPLLNDRWAKDVMSHVDYKPKMNANFVRIVTLRARLLDTWATEFLDVNPDATVLQLACGLDSRALRLSPGRRVRWIDVDLPDVVELRKRLLAAPSDNYTLVASSVLEQAWLDAIPTDRPVLVIAEGLLQYLEPADVQRLFRRLCRHFTCGEVIFDAIGSLHLRLQAWRGPIRNTGAVYHTAIDSADDFVEALPGMAVRNVLQVWQWPGMQFDSFLMRLLVWVLLCIPGMRTYFSAHRYSFGAVGSTRP